MLMGISAAELCDTNKLEHVIEVFKLTSKSGLTHLTLYLKFTSYLQYVHLNTLLCQNIYNIHYI